MSFQTRRDCPSSVTFRNKKIGAIFIVTTTEFGHATFFIIYSCILYTFYSPLGIIFVNVIQQCFICPPSLRFHCVGGWNWTKDCDAFLAPVRRSFHHPTVPSVATLTSTVGGGNRKTTWVPCYFALTAHTIYQRTFTPNFDENFSIEKGKFSTPTRSLSLVTCAQCITLQIALNACTESRQKALGQSNYCTVKCADHRFLYEHTGVSPLTGRHSGR